MWEEEVLPRALQNHLLQDKHRTTLLGLWMPQYLCLDVSMSQDVGVLTHAQAWGGSSFSSSGLGCCF